MGLLCGTFLTTAFWKIFFNYKKDNQNPKKEIKKEPKKSRSDLKFEKMSAINEDASIFLTPYLNDCRNIGIEPTWWYYVTNDEKLIIVAKKDLDDLNHCSVFIGFCNASNAPYEIFPKEYFYEEYKYYDSNKSNETYLCVDDSIVCKVYATFQKSDKYKEYIKLQQETQKTILESIDYRELPISKEL